MQQILVILSYILIALVAVALLVVFPIAICTALKTKDMERTQKLVVDTIIGLSITVIVLVIFLLFRKYI